MRRTNASTVSTAGSEELRINKDLLLKLLLEAFEASHKADDQQLILFVGNTGSGKSTTINYLLGCLMESYEDEMLGMDVIRVSPGSTEYAKIGHDLSNSETLYPQTIKVAGEKYFYCDCPGFDDSRGPEYDICATLATKVAINSAKNILNLVVVIEQAAISVSRAEGLRKVFQTLQSLFNQSSDSHIRPIDALQLQSAVTFVVTKCDPRKKTIPLLKRIRAERADEKTSESQNIVFMCNLMLANAGSSIIEINPLDSGDSRERFKERFRKSKPILPKYFGLPASANTQHILLEMLSEIADYGSKLLSSAIELPDKIAKNKQVIINEKQSYADHKKQLEDLTNDKSPGTSNDTNALANLLGENKLRSADKRKRLPELEQKQKKLTADIENLDSTTPVEFWTETFDEQKVFGLVKKGVRNTYHFQYVNAPFVKKDWESRGVGCEYWNEKSAPKAGEYSVSFTTGPDFYGTGIVKILVEKCQVPDNVRALATKRQELENLNKEIERLQGSLTELDERYHNLADQIVSLEKEQSKDAKEYRAKLSEMYTQELQVTSNRIRELEQKTEALEALQAGALLQIPEQKAQFSLVRKIAPLLGRLSSSTKHFLKLYNQYKPASAAPSQHFSESLMSNPVYSTLQKLKQQLKNHVSYSNNSDSTIIAEKNVAQHVKAYLAKKSQPTGLDYCINDMRDFDEFYPGNAEQIALGLRQKNYLAAAHLLVKHINFPDKELLRGELASIGSESCHNAKMLLQRLKTISDLFVKVSLKEKPYSKWKGEDWLTAIDQSEYLINCEQKIRPVMTVTEHDTHIFVQVDEPVQALTNAQIQEYRQLADIGNEPDWFATMAPWEQSYWQQRMISYKQTKDFNTVLHTFPATFVKYPGIAFYLHHHFLMFKKGSIEPELHVVRARSSVLHSYSRGNSNLKKQTNEKIREANFDQLFAVELPRAFSRILEKLPRNIGEQEILIPLLMTTNLSPVVSATLERLFGRQETVMVDEISKSRKKVEKRYEISSQIRLEFIGGNQAVNDVRINSKNKLLSAISSERSDPEVFKAILRCVLNYFQRVKLEQDTDQYDTLIETLSVNLSTPENIDVNCLHENIQSGSDNWHLVDVLLTQGLAEVLYLHHNELDSKLNKELVISAIHKVLIAVAGGSAHSTCKSGKDRTAIMLLYEDSILTYVMLYHKFPKLSDSAEDRKSFIKIFGELFVSGHHQLLTNSNASGCFGLKSLKDVLPSDIYLHLTTLYPKFVAVNDLCSNLNRRKDMKKIDRDSTVSVSSGSAKAPKCFPVVRIRSNSPYEASNAGYARLNVFSGSNNSHGSSDEPDRSHAPHPVFN